MDKFSHDRIIIGMILSLGIAHLLKGVAKLIEHPAKNKPYWVHLLWVGYIFLLLVHFWWWEFRLSHVAQWTFGTYAFIILFIVVIYIISSLMFPDDMSDYHGFKEYYYSRSTWIFSLLALVFLLDYGDALLKGPAYMQELGPEFKIRFAGHFFLCLVAARVKKEWVHAGLAIAFIGYGVSWILRQYNVQ